MTFVATKNDVVAGVVDVVVVDVAVDASECYDDLSVQHLTGQRPRRPPPMTFDNYFDADDDEPPPLPPSLSDDGARPMMSAAAALDRRPTEMAHILCSYFALSAPTYHLVS